MRGVGTRRVFEHRCELWQFPVYEPFLSNRPHQGASRPAEGDNVASR